MDICQVFLGEKDEVATARRYPSGTASGEAAGDAAAGLARDIVDCANVIKERITEDLLGQSGEERLSIMKELDGNK